MAAVQDLMPEWNKYMRLYNFREIFHDNKIEEYLYIFGRRQINSCIDFATGTEKVADPRKIRTFPMAQKDEAEYDGTAIGLIDF